LKNRINRPIFQILLSLVLAVALLGIFIGLNYFLNERSLHRNPDQDGSNEREQIPETTGLKARRLAFYDFEWGNASDTSLHLATTGHGGKQSLRMSSSVPFSPGLWVRFKDLNPGDHAWIRAAGYVWFTCPPEEAKCSLVVTCNHNGINYKYMFIPVEKEDVKSGQWNRISIDYRIPQASDAEDVLQAYFWYRGKGEVLVDDIEIEFFINSQQPMSLSAL